MPRGRPSVSPPRLAEPTARVATTEFALRTITPMFGGSVRAREAEALHPVRVPSVRGHLRFWWRAINGAKYGSTRELFEAEASIWGSAAGNGGGGSKVKIEIENPRQEPASVTLDDKQGGRYRFGDAVRYGGFSFQRDGNQEPAKGLGSFEFVMHISCPGLSSSRPSRSVTPQREADLDSYERKNSTADRLSAERDSLMSGIASRWSRRAG